MTAVPQYPVHHHKPTTVLIVEDEAVSRRTLACLLKSCGFVIEAVGSAEKALESVLDHRPDIALVDVDLPDMNGMQLIEQLRRSDPQIRGVLITACERERVEALVRRGVPHLRKPLDFQALLALLMQLQRPH
jgi:CheY-like chemotaxis protein